MLFTFSNFFCRQKDTHFSSTNCNNQHWQNKSQTVSPKVRMTICFIFIIQAKVIFSITGYWANGPVCVPKQFFAIILIIFNLFTNSRQLILKLHHVLICLLSVNVKIVCKSNLNENVEVKTRQRIWNTISRFMLFKHFLFLLWARCVLKNYLKQRTISIMFKTLPVSAWKYC